MYKPSQLDIANLLSTVGKFAVVARTQAEDADAHNPRAPSSPREWDDRAARWRQLEREALAAIAAVPVVTDEAEEAAALAHADSQAA